MTDWNAVPEYTPLAVRLELGALREEVAALQERLALGPDKRHTLDAIIDDLYDRTEKLAGALKDLVEALAGRPQPQPRISLWTRVKMRLGLPIFP